MRTSVLLSIALIVAGSSPSASQPPAFQVPAGAKIEPSGLATIEQAPPSPFPELPPAENRPKDGRGFYAQLAGVSDTEAAKRIEEQQATRPEFERVLKLLRQREAGNFTSARLVHKPDWAYVFYFKRAPEQTLAKYVRKPHFKAAQARYSTAELRAISKPWVDRFLQHRLLAGHGTDATFGEVAMHLTVSEAEFRDMASRQGWGPVPEAIKLEFSEPVEGLPVASDLQSFIRIFPQSDRSLGATNQALLGGRIVLRNGCFYVTGGTGADRLAYFGREIALVRDADGYVSLRTRAKDPRHLGRIGEQFSWAGPIGITEDAPMVAELRRRCGNSPLEHVGVPQSSRLFEVRPWVIDAIADRRRISREEAYRRFRTCVEQREAQRPGGMLSCDML